MFSQLTLTSFQIVFTYFSTWNTPFQWNNKTKEIEITRNKFQLIRWRLNTVFQIIYILFVFFRLYQSYLQDRISMNQLITQFPQLVIFFIYFMAELTTTLHGTELLFIFNQMKKNNFLFSQGIVQKRWDGFGVFWFYLISIGSIYP